MARRKSNNYFDLHEVLDDKSYDHAVICTYTFEAPFFEDYCLDRLSSLSHNGNITVLVDRGVYEKSITGPESYRPKIANIRYLLHPVSVPGVFHSKLCLLVNKTRGRLIIGSANFTRPGLTSNAEMVGCYDYEAEKEESLRPLFQAAFKYFIEVNTKWPGEQLNSNLQAILRDAPWLDLGDDVLDTSECVLLDNLTEPLWEQITTGITEPVQTIYLLSRYFDSHPNILDKLQQDLRPSKIKIFTQNGITNLTADWLKHPTVKSGETEILLCRYSDDGQHAQPLHAKGIVIEKDGERIFAFGSANFTSAALLKTARTGNAETLLLLRAPINRAMNPERLFDPNRTAVHLKHEASLQSSRSEEEEFEYSHHAITLLESSLNDDRLIVRADVPMTIDRNSLSVILTSQPEFKRMLELSHQNDQIFAADVPNEIAQRLERSSTTVQLQGFLTDGKAIDSNPLLLTNLLDIQNDRPVRRERHIKEAQQNAAQFFAVLKDLLQGSDEQALLSFLSFCDIPVAIETRSRMFRGIKSVWDGGAGMRNLGERNFKVYLSLHEAVLGFFDKHFRKLQRHVRDKEPSGIANFLHIFLAMGGVLRAQMERLSQGLESRTSPLTSREWYDCRNHIDAYLGRFRKMMDCLWKDYLSPMLQQYEKEEIREEFEPDLQPLHDLYLDMLSFHERIEGWRSSKLASRSFNIEVKAPNYFECILGEKYWPKYAAELNANLTKIESSVV